MYSIHPVKRGNQPSALKHFREQLVQVKFFRYFPLKLDIKPLVNVCCSCTLNHIVLVTACYNYTQNHTVLVTNYTQIILFYYCQNYTRISIVFSDMIYLTAIWQIPDGSSTVHIYTQTIHRTIQSTKQYIEQHCSLIRKSADRVPSLRVIPWQLPCN